MFKPRWPLSHLIFLSVALSLSCFCWRAGIRKSVAVSLWCLDGATRRTDGTDGTSAPPAPSRFVVVGRGLVQNDPDCGEHGPVLGVYRKAQFNHLPAQPPVVLWWDVRSSVQTTGIFLVSCGAPVDPAGPFSRSLRPGTSVLCCDVAINKDGWRVASIRIAPAVVQTGRAI